MEDSDRLVEAVLLDAGHKCYATEYEAEFWAICRELKRPHAPIVMPKILPVCSTLLLPIMKGYEDQLAAAWNHPPAKVFSLMGLRTVAEMAEAFHLTLMDCAGYDICLYDKFAKQVGTYEEIMGDELEIDPFTLVFHKLTTLAHHAIKLSLNGLLNGHEQQKIAC